MPLLFQETLLHLSTRQKNVDGSYNVDLSSASVTEGSYVIYSLEPARNSDDGSHGKYHISMVSDFTLYAKNQQSGEELVNGSSFVSQHPGWGTLWGVFRNQSNVSMKDISRSTDDGKMQLNTLVENYSQYKNPHFFIFNNDGQLLAKDQTSFNFSTAGVYIVQFSGQLANGDYVWNSAKIKVSSSAVESKTITQTIHYQYPDETEAADTYTKSLTFTRTKYTDAVTGEVTYGAWSTDQSFDAVTSPSLKGYTPDQAEIGAQRVNGDSQDLNFTVKYMKDSTDSDKQDGSNSPSDSGSNGTYLHLSETTTTQTDGKPLPSKQQHDSRLEKYHKLPDTAKKEQHYSMAGLLGITAALSFFGLSKRFHKND